MIATLPVFRLRQCVKYHRAAAARRRIFARANEIDFGRGIQEPGEIGLLVLNMANVAMDAAQFCVSDRVLFINR